MAITILVTGANGQLGNAIQQVAATLPASQYQFVFTNSSSLNITNEIAIQQIFSNQHFDYCINCAAYTAVDKAETEKANALATNATAVKFLAQACHQHQTKLIHISTDYVFDGTATTPYKTDANTNPINYYGQTKLLGEQLAFQENEATIIIRTAWVYSLHGNNFVKTMLRLMNEKESIGVVHDQQGTPTYAPDLAAAIVHIITTQLFKPGIYHFTNNGNTTWFGFAQAIANHIQTTCIVNAINTSQFPTPAKRPAYSILDVASFEKTFQYNIPQWQHSLTTCLSHL
ncbi:dTDP-4-dehydrorhamnose reductase [Ferruginibacter yonginensis]|uniref:dTDP-4-dehydrorhamnose reductase n=1 Tax=Ferruginibacter yonginensis TaxID=1310416 RepID=A0ABV8QVU0_9BACT